jgi:L-aspartate oxidase
MKQKTLWKKKSQPAHLDVSNDLEFDFLVIGAGIAGISLALQLSELGSVCLVAKESLEESNTLYAQGGIASVFLKSDTYEAHIQDTLIAGAGLCHEEIVSKIVSSGPACIQNLVNIGVKFTKDNAPNKQFEFHLTQEGGHSARRIIHADDFTGYAVQKTLCENVKQNKNITCLEHQTCIDLIVTDKAKPDFSRNRCLGAYVLSEKESNIKSILAKATFLATGGHGKLYLYTSNPDIATGDGLAMAWRAGARVANLEFMQFHPTCLYNEKNKTFLMTEALRGEGGILLNRAGERFMQKIDTRMELAPRDIVARAIDSEIKKSGEAFVYLDISHKEPEFIKSHFPNIFSKCLEVGIDITKEPIPVVPAAHYSCGGVVTDSRGRTGVKALWALGEVACTGFHGANRLASNSLLEGLVMADFVKKDIFSLWPELKNYQIPSVPKWNLGTKQGIHASPDELVVVSQLWDEIRRAMWNYVGIVRSDKRLARAYARLTQINEEIETFYWNVQPNRNLLEVRNLALIGLLTVKCARLRKESRGIHHSLDYPKLNDLLFAKDTVLTS